MSTINQLTSLDSVSAGDLFALWSSQNSDARKVSAAVVLAYMQSNLVFPDVLTRQAEAPSATGFSISVTGTGVSVRLIISPLAGYANGTIVLPLSSTVVDQQRLVVTCTQAVTTLAITGNGATVYGAPTTLAANDAFTLMYDKVNNAWYQVHA